MKRIKRKQGNVKCDFCKVKGKITKATWQHFSTYACTEHKKSFKIDDGYQSEGERQAMRLFGI